MPQFNSLFWKVFLSFWIANLLIVALTTFIVISINERERNSEIHKIRIQNVSERIIEHIERDGKNSLHGSETQNKSPWSEYKPALSGEDREHGKRSFRRIPPMRIYSESGELVFSTPISKRIERRDKVTLNVEGDSGKRYTVESFVGPPSHIKKALNFFTRVQLVLILIASMVVSVLLSWSIARPLKKLSQFSKTYMPGEKSELDSNLINRKDEIGELSQSFQAMLQKLEQTLQGQKHLLHDVSHELRAPLSRLQVTVGLLEESTQDKAPLLKRLHKECARIDQLIQEILNYSRVDTYQSDPRKISLECTLKEMLENIQLIEPERNVNLNMPQIAHIQATPELVARVFENIFSNALSHTSTDCDIDVDVKLDLHNCYIRIRDHGTGVKDTDLDKLFELFYRAKNDMHGKGFGLGLSIAKRAIELDKGAISLNNHPEGGLVVELVYPKS